MDSLRSPHRPGGRRGGLIPPGTEQQPVLIDAPLPRLYDGVTAGWNGHNTGEPTRVNRKVCAVVGKGLSDRGEACRAPVLLDSEGLPW